jgi:integrase
MKPDAKATPNRGLSFLDWAGALRADDSLSPGLRESYRRTLVDFLRFCQQRVAGATVVLAREYVELARLEHAPAPARLQEWKDGLNWFFRRGREASSTALRGVPPLARSDLGRTDWEQRLVARLRLKGFSWRTEQTYRGWAWRLARFLGRRPMSSATGAEARAFLTRQKQALNALVFYLREVEGKEPGDFSDFARARRRVRMPVVLNRAECERLFEAMEGRPRLMAELMFGSGVRLTELLRLRIKDVDLERGQLIVRAGKGDQDRVTVLPQRLQEKLRA